MGKKRKRQPVDQGVVEQQAESEPEPLSDHQEADAQNDATIIEDNHDHQTDEQQEQVQEDVLESKQSNRESQNHPHQQHQTPTLNGSHKHKKPKRQTFTRIAVDPSRKYNTPESRESWGPNVKGKKFRKEKGKKKRCPSAGLRIDGSIKSIRLDS